LLIGAVFATTFAFAGAASADEKTPCDGGPGTCIKIGTLAPKQSLWGTVFQAWARAVLDESGKQLELQIFYNGQQGDEPGMIAKMRNNQLDGAAVTARGLATIWPHILAFQLPGVFVADDPNTMWAKVDGARNAHMPYVHTQFESKGFRIVGVGDVGIAHIMSKREPVRVPADLKAHKAFYITGDQTGLTMLRVAGVSGNPLEVPLILPNLKNNTIDMIVAPALAAEQFQWTPEMEHINTMHMGVGVGGLVFKVGPDSKFAALSDAHKEILKKTGKNAGDLLTARVRAADNAAFERAKGKLAVFNPTPDQKAEWAKFFASVHSQVCGSALDAEFCTKLKNSGK
jgi:TRAP-type C4-dicarboxylate transport system substrate-binding protein